MNHYPPPHSSLKFDQGALRMNLPIHNSRLGASLGAILGLLSTAGSALATGLDFGGVAYFSYDQQTWATLVDQAPYVSTSNMGGTSHPSPSHPRFDDGNLYPTADQNGSRYLYPVRFFDYRTHPNFLANPNYAAASNTFILGLGGRTPDPDAVAQYRLFNNADHVPLAQPAGGFSIPVDSLAPGLDWGWANTPNTESTLQLQDDQAAYDPVNNPIVSAFIQLGGSMHLASDFNNPQGTLQFTDLFISKDPGRGDKWYLGGWGYLAFELVNPQLSINPNNGLLSLAADYKWGDSDWSDFLQIAGYPQADTILGHFSLNPVPTPGAMWLLASALFGLVGLQRRKRIAL